MNNSNPPSGLPMRSVARDEDMAAFDALPFELREALRNTPFGMVAKPVQEALAHYGSVRRVLRLIEHSTREALAAAAREQGRPA